jgi:hypothetical protein
MLNIRIYTLVYFIETETLKKKAVMLFREREFCLELINSSFEFMR